ncbi:MAG TPA: non-canonical purine NTP pyrophosphatase [Terriglobia bacterium]|nr:non-canonical purine NTP pyrophosphatase [Terriglobia bacterium]
MTRLYLASSNPGKLREFREAAAARGVQIEPLPGFSDLPACVEDGATFEENARKKAMYYSRNNPGWVFADDSGICVDALQGAPGVYSARFAGPQASDDQNNARLIEEIHRIESEASARMSTPPPDRNSKAGNRDPLPNGRSSSFDLPVWVSSTHRAAHYICVIALAEAGRILTVVEGRADGFIIDQPRGTGGFGYDPYFYYPPLGETFAELLPEAKFAVSHRGAAFRKLLDVLGARSQGS